MHLVCLREYPSIVHKGDSEDRAHHLISSHACFERRYGLSCASAHVWAQHLYIDLCTSAVLCILLCAPFVRPVHDAERGRERERERNIERGTYRDRWSEKDGKLQKLGRALIWCKAGSEEVHRSRRRQLYRDRWCFSWCPSKPACRVNGSLRRSMPLLETYQIGYQYSE